jgi:BTB/POZ domain
VKIEVGPEKRIFIIHQKLLSEKATVFDKMFNGSFKEATEQSASLPADDIESFQIFVEWLYRGEITANTHEEGKGWLTLYHFASKYIIQELADRALTAYIQALGNDDLPSIAELGHQYGLASEGSKLRQFVVNAATYALVHYTDGGAWDIDDFVDQFRQYPQFQVDVLKSVRDFGDDDPRKHSKCVYHQHGTFVCPYE